MFRKNSGIEKFQANEGGSFTVLSKIFFLTGPKNPRQGTILCLKISGREKYFMDKRGGVSRFSVEKFLSDYQNISLENTLVFQKILLSKIFMHRGGGGGHHGFVEFFCLTGPKRKTL